MATLQIDGVGKSYGQVSVLDDVNIKIDDGDFLILLGPSGCGKSTLLNLIAGLDNISEGEIRIDNQRINDRPARDRDIAMVFQSYALYPTMTVRENIEFGMKVRKVPKPARKEALDRVASLLQIQALLDRKSSQLSGGQRQRVAIGRALVRNPKLFLFDEPLSNLDAKLRDDMRTEIKKLHQRLKTTIVYVTHDQIEAMTLGTKVAVMKGGMVQQLADPETIYNYPSTVYVARFVGSPAMNILNGTLVRTQNGSAAVRLNRSGASPVDVGPIELSAESVEKHVGKQVLVGMRPEHFRTAVDPTAGFDVRVEVVEPTGPDALVFFNLGDKEVIARLPPRSVKAEQTALLTVDATKTILFDPATENRII
ncbi:ABC transporter ATP-binding protein [Rhizobium sp. BK060]|uniref:ABC transporter ATP-binding protein n=1 Tax=Rhizobium sp. BK060 TaxID=2587096 RepID=UPI0016209A8E|nr:ABC transporter ATP-binding protein [Rhizobium sp. BK060]MBB3396004.1 multiple sugar transport system ATP-binding protein [Rhizobium sp. BK060]